MKRFLCVVFAIAFVLALAACTGDNNDVTTLATTTSAPISQTTTSPSQKGTTTTNTTATTTAQSDGSTTTLSSDETNTDNVTTTTNITTTTTKNSTLSNNVVMYAEHPNVPDYGAMLGLDCDMYKNNVYYYKVTNVEQADPQKNSGSQYMQLLLSCGYGAYKNYHQGGVEGYLYVNPNLGIVVLFGAAPAQGAIVVAISQQ